MKSENFVLSFQLCVAVSVCAFSFAVHAASDCVDWVDPFVGTAGTGHTTPAACVPFGLVQAGPDTGNYDWSHCSGYNYNDKVIYGFSQTHLNGTGCPDLGDIRIMPYYPTGSEGSINHQEPVKALSEAAKPGYYMATLEGGTKVEISATEHCAIYRFTSGAEGLMKLLVDGQWGMVNKNIRFTYVKESQVSVDADGCGIAGWKKTHGWNKRTTGFAVRFDRKCVSAEKLPPLAKEEKGARYVFSFNLKKGETMYVKVAISASGTNEARGSLSAEIPGWDFDAVKKSARAKWSTIFARAVVDGSEEQKKNWYTSLYHLCIQPNNIADFGKKPLYSTFSCWDTFRAAGPLYTILMPDKAAEFVDSMLEQGRRTGYLPIWTLWGDDNQCMIGTHSIPMIVDWFLKERECDRMERAEYWKGAYAQIKDTLTKLHKGRVKERWDLLDKYGYYPFDMIKGESVSRTMECAYDDWCAGVMAEKLGFKEDAAFFMKRSENWRNVFDNSIGMVRGKDSKGNWREPFNPFTLGHGAASANDFTEGNAFQYTWHVMQNPRGLIEAMGGRDVFVKRLDSLFSQPETVEGAGFVLDVTGLIGQYVHGNEPSHHVIYFYPQVGCPEKAAERIREVFDKFYLPKPDGLCGNDDCGQMSAWYLFSAMGFYPFNPCGGEYILGAPQVPKVVLRLGGEHTFTIVAKNLSRANKYVKSVTLNGKPVTDWKIRHADIMAGGELVFEMTNGK